MTTANADRARAAFLCACQLDVAVRKPGNVSRASPGHGMHAQLFVASAQAAAPHLFAPGAGVGERIEKAVAASWAAAGCNTNLGIVLLCAPVAVAIERQSPGQPLSNGRGPWAGGAAALREAIDSVLDGLSVEDAHGAFRAIVQAHPGGLGSAPEQDVHDAPQVNLREAMALAAARDRIAMLYRDGFASLIEMALPALGGVLSGVVMGSAHGLHMPLPPAVVDAVQRLYLSLLAAWPDSHIVRKHGEAVAHSVMPAAAAWSDRLQRGGAPATRPDDDPAFAAWDESLKAQQINPGTTADLTVAGLFIALLML